MRLWLLSKSKVAKPKPIREGTLGRDAQRAPFREEGRWGAARRVPCEHLTIHRAGGHPSLRNAWSTPGDAAQGAGTTGSSSYLPLKLKLTLGRGGVSFLEISVSHSDAPVVTGDGNRPARKDLKIQAKLGTSPFETRNVGGSGQARCCEGVWVCCKP